MLRTQSALFFFVFGRRNLSLAFAPLSREPRSSLHRMLVRKTQISHARITKIGGEIRALLLCGSGHGRIVRSLAASCRRPLYNTRAKRGYTGGKVRFPPRAPCAVRSPENKAHSLWLAKHFTHSRYCELRNTDFYGRLRTFTDCGRMA